MELTSKSMKVAYANFHVRMRTLRQICGRLKAVNFHDPIADIGIVMHKDGADLGRVVH